MRFRTTLPNVIALALLTGPFSASSAATPHVHGAGTLAGAFEDDVAIGREEEATPESRAHHQLAYHPAEDRIYLMGGGTTTDAGHKTFDDMWVWAKGAWSRLDAPLMPRAGHRLVYSSRRGALLLFGGVGADSRLHAWNGAQWTAIGQGPDAATAEPGVCYDERRDRLVVHGGVDEAGFLSPLTWEWDGESFSPESETGPGGRLGHVFVWDPVSQTCLLHGGRDGQERVRSDTWSWDGQTWRDLNASGPGPRWIHAAVSDPFRSRIVLFGGQDEAGDLLGDSWAWNGEAWRSLASPQPGPAPRMMGQLAAMPQGVLMFGGRAANPEAPPLYRDRSDTWLLTEAGWEQRQ